LAREVFDIQASTDGLAISADGNYIMTGFQAARIRHWDGAHYDILWTSGMASRYVSQLLISPDNSYCVSCWYASTYDRNYIRVHDLESGLPIWSYTYRQGTGYQDWPVDVDMSEDGNWFVVGSWGDQGSQNGEAVVFSRYYREPYYELDMPGSCLSLDLSSDGHYLTSCGKHVHANVFGNGGDMILVDLDLPTEPEVSTEITLFTEGGICAHQDTVLFETWLYNTGYGIFFADSLTGLGTDLRLADSALFIDGITPADSMKIVFKYTPQTAGLFDRYFRVYGSGQFIEFHLIADVIECPEDANTASPLNLTYALHPAYPNPFNAETRIAFGLEKPSEIILEAYTVTGRLAETIKTGFYSAGEHSVVWSPTDLASGVYLLRLQAANRSFTSKLMYLK
jgi:hypothetical protein